MNEMLMTSIHFNKACFAVISAVYIFLQFSY